MEARPRKGGRSPSGVGADEPGLDSSSPSSTSVHLRPEHGIGQHEVFQSHVLFPMRFLHNTVCLKDTNTEIAVPQ